VLAKLHVADRAAAAPARPGWAGLIDHSPAFAGLTQDERGVKVSITR
jgi:hypothetical protein